MKLLSLEKVRRRAVVPCRLGPSQAKGTIRKKQNGAIASIVSCSLLTHFYYLSLAFVRLVDQ